MTWSSLMGGREAIMRVLFVGASGLIGRQVVPLLQQHVDLTLAGLEEGETAGLPVVGVDITDWSQVEQVVEAGSASGAPFDAIVNCAIAAYRGVDKSGLEGVRRYFEHCIDVNARGAYHVYEAAARTGVPRVVYISSMTTVLGPPRYDAINETCSDRPNDVYAASKLFGEHVGRYYAYRDEAGTSPLRVVCLRLGHPYRSFSHSDEMWLTSKIRRSVATHTSDIAQAILCALEVDVMYGVYTIVSDSDVPYVDPALYAELGYSPAYKFTVDGIISTDEILASIMVPVLEESVV
jgi:nucleoside-diphosphate-sugar epimerase